ncbi:MAG: hypothetical protein PHD81_04450 [Candidatus Nanoarchaeia archaeon]|nr:hypothetical protein [Candidatus Nanoarchaeia archaeon]MDD5588329.1 hypothetical protein [Candidatus Nanoarchaeia archaeon]
MLTKEDYDKFVEDFSKKLKNHKDVCFYLYGSYTTGNCDYGRSDIDGGLILNNQFITDKEKMLDISNSLCECLIEHPIEEQFNVLDRGTNLDGRFLSYTKDYTDWIKNHGKVIKGDEKYISELNGHDFKSNILYSTSFNLRFLRNSLLKSRFNVKKNQDVLAKDFERYLKTFTGLPKKLIYLRTGELLDRRFVAQDKIKELLGHDPFYLNETNQILSNIKKLEKFSKDPGIVISILTESLTDFELMIKEYVCKYPEIGEREFKI